MSALASKRFGDEFAALLDRNLLVTTSRGQKVSGRLVAYNPSDYSIWLGEVRFEGRVIHRVFIPAHEISMIEVEEAGPDLQKLYERINRLFPNMARYYRDAGVIVVMDRIRVTKDGVVEGGGPAAERVQKIYEEWAREEAQRQD